MAKDMAGEEMPMDLDHGPFHFTEGTLTYAGMHLHVEDQLVHTHLGRRAPDRGARTRIRQHGDLNSPA